jgi:hypothetical protein
VAMTSVLALASGQFWPSPVPGMCTSGAAPGRGGNLGMVLFKAISISFTMVVSQLSFRVYIKSDTNV